MTDAAKPAVPLKIGDAATFSKTISESDVYLFSGITGDFSPMHLDAQYAGNTQYGQRIAQGVLTFALGATASTKIHEAYDDEYTAISYGYDHIRFTGPVFLGDTVTVTYTISAIDEVKARTTADLVYTNQDGKVVCVCNHIACWFPA